MLDTKNDRLKDISPFKYMAILGCLNFRGVKDFSQMVWVPAFEETPFLVTL